MALTMLHTALGARRATGCAAQSSWLLSARSLARERLLRTADRHSGGLQIFSAVPSTARVQQLRGCHTGPSGPVGSSRDGASPAANRGAEGNGKTSSVGSAPRWSTPPIVLRAGPAATAAAVEGQAAASTDDEAMGALGGTGLRFVSKRSDHPGAAPLPADAAAAPNAAGSLHRDPGPHTLGVEGDMSLRGRASLPQGADSPGGDRVELTMSERMREHERCVAKTAARPDHGPTEVDHGPLRETGLWKVEEVVDTAKETVDFRRIDDIESELMQSASHADDAITVFDEEERWKHRMMFIEKVAKTPKHLTWKELGEEVECLDCVIDLDEHRPEEIFYITFSYVNKKTGMRDVIWRAKNDVAYSEGFTDLMSAIGACLGRSDVHRTIRFDDGTNTTRDIAIRKRSRYTSDITIAFRQPETYNKYERKDEEDEYERAMTAQGMSTWGFHPALMDPEYNALDFDDPERTYTIAISAHAFSIIFLKAVKRLLARPLKEFYRPSQVMRTARVKTEDDIGLVYALKGWMGIDELVYPHYTTIDALQGHWLGKDAPFTLTAIINKLREMTYLKKESPEFQSWLSVRHHDTNVAIRNMGVKLLGAGASTLFVPVGHDATVNRLLPKHQQRKLESRVSLNSLFGMPDETRNIEEFKKITGHARLPEVHEGTAGSGAVSGSAPADATGASAPK